MIARTLALLLSVSAVICASQSPAPKTSDTTKRNATQTASQNQSPANPAQNPVPPITVVIQEPPKDVAAEAKKDQRDERMVHLANTAIFVAVVTLFFLAWQSWETRKSADATRESVAVAVKTIEAKVFCRQVTIDLDKGILDVGLENTGILPATNVIGEAESTFALVVAPQPQRIRAITHKFGGTVNPGPVNIFPVLLHPDFVRAVRELESTPNVLLLLAIELRYHNGFTNTGHSQSAFTYESNPPRFTAVSTFTDKDALERMRPPFSSGIFVKLRSPEEQPNPQNTDEKNGT
jgi:hypothetical protein